MFIENIFSLLTDNKELPYYQAERRMDIFFNIYLEEILNHFLDKTNIVYVAPEFPLKKEDTRLSTKIDYLCFDTAEKIIYFVELKTDDKSFRGAQFNTYSTYTRWDRCVDELEIISAKQPKAYRDKFSKLKERLYTFGLLSPEARAHPIKTVYIAPTKQEDCLTITFNELSAFTPSRYPDEWVIFKKYFLVS